MVNPISLATMPVVAWLIALLSRDAGYGFMIVAIAHTIIVQVLGSGIYTYPEVFWSWNYAILAGALAGYIESLVFNFYPVLQMLQTYRANGKNQSMKKFWWLAFKVVLFLTLAIAAHIAIEIQIFSWKTWMGTLTSMGAIALVWLLFWGMLREETNPKTGTGLFRDGVSTGKKGKLKRWGNELMAFILWPALHHIIYVTIYGFWEYGQIKANPVVWFGDRWYLWASLSLTGFLTIFFCSLGFYFRRRAMKKGMRPAPLEETEVETPTPSPSSETPVKGSYNVFGFQQK